MTSPRLPALFLALGLFLVPAYAAKPPASRGPAPAWTLKTPDGKAVSLADYKGKIVVLNFWATWCPPCRAELPGFGAIAKAYAPKGVEFVGLSLDALQGDVGAIAPMTAKAGVAYPSVLATQEVLAAYGGIEGIPTTFFIDRQGRIAAGHVGGMEEAELKKELDGLVKEPVGK